MWNVLKGMLIIMGWNLKIQLRLRIGIDWFNVIKNLLMIFVSWLNIWWSHRERL
jgi:hypothetical protein